MRKHLLYYISLMFILGIGFFLSGYFAHEKEKQILFIVMTTFFYVVWGVLHHVVHHSFSLRIMLEYIAVGIFGISLILFIFNVAL